jgi:hypothetical protein
MSTEILNLQGKAICLTYNQAIILAESILEALK